jgi:hypothetical protein
VYGANFPSSTASVPLELLTRDVISSSANWIGVATPSAGRAVHVRVITSFQELMLVTLQAVAVLKLAIKSPTVK